jgi:hypothetical protein
MPDELELGQQLEFLGARVRRRRDGSLHTVDFGTAPQNATDELIAQLAGTSRLHALLLPHSQITDAAAPSLARMQDLAELDLRGTLMSDVGLMQLTSLVKLKILQLTGAPASRDGVRSLRQSLLNCRIIFLEH